MQNSQTNEDFVQRINGHLKSVKAIDFQYFNDIQELLKTSSVIKSIENQTVYLANGIEINLQNLVSINQHYAPQYADYQNVISCRC